MLPRLDEVDVGSSGIVLVGLGARLNLEVEIPELDVGFRGRSQRREDEVTSLGRPEDGVRGLAVESFCRDKVQLGVKKRQCRADSLSKRKLPFLASSW